MKYNNIREEALKNKVGADWFKSFDTTEIIGNIDFTVFPKQSNIFGRTPLLWAEAKTGDFDIPTMFVQLILTIGKARTFDHKPLQFSEEATAVFNAGRELWKYYHSHNDINVNASLYDIREYFQGRNDKGRMNPRSDNEIYTQLITDLRYELDLLAEKITPKIYEYGFLKK